MQGPSLGRQLPLFPMDGCHAGFWVSPEVLLRGLVVLQLLLDALKLGLQVHVASGNRRISLILTILPSGPGLNPGIPGAGTDLST